MTNLSWGVGLWLCGWVAQSAVAAPAGLLPESLKGRRAAFGASLAADGKLLVVGAPMKDPGYDLPMVGEAVVFELRRNGTWGEGVSLFSLLPTDVAPMRYGAGFGTAVAVDGGRIAVGAPGAGAGSVFLFSLGAEGWKLEQVVRGFHSGDRFGASVALSAGKLLVGAPGAHDESGSAYLYDCAAACAQSAGWTGTQPREELGSAVALTQDHGFIGAPFWDSGAHEDNAGRVMVVSRVEGGRWAPNGSLEPASPGVRGMFGAALAASGNQVLVGSPLGGEDTHRGLVGRGEAYRFALHGSAWTQVERWAPTAQPSGSENFGAAVALREGRVAFGAPHSKADLEVGQAYFGSGNAHDLPVASGGEYYIHFGAAVALVPGGWVVGAPGLNGKDGNVFLFSNAGN